MKAISAGVVVCLLTVAMSAAGSSLARTPKGLTVPLENLGFNGSLDRLPGPKNWKVKEVSSFDRSGGNDDDRGGQAMEGGGFILADLNGPGVVTRLWTKNPTGTLYIFVDDVEHPIITTTFKDFFQGGLELWTPGFNLMGPPFVGEGAGGYYSYIPIPFEKRCRIAVSTQEPALAYQVTYAELPKDTPIQSFDLSLSEDDRQFFRRWKHSWTKFGMRWPDDDEKVRKSRHNYWPNTDSAAVSLVGPGTIKEIELKLESADPEILAGTWLSVRFDGQKEPGVLAPIGTFFGAAGRDTGDHATVVVGRIGERMWCRFPMPFHKTAEVRFINKTKEVADIAYWVTWQKGAKKDDEYFFAQHNAATTVAGKPYLAASIAGQGHYVGTTLGTKNTDSLTFLEGDDTYLIDGAAADAFHGTGTDDYFDGGWYFAGGKASAPTRAVSFKKGEAPMGFMAFRSHLTEPVPFTQSFVFELEHGPHNDRPGAAYESVAYWYQSSVDAAAPKARLAESTSR